MGSNGSPSTGLRSPATHSPSRRGADGLAVPAKMSRDRGDRRTASVQRLSADVFLPCQHGKRGLLREIAVIETAIFEGAPPATGEAHVVGLPWSDRPSTTRPAQSRTRSDNPINRRYGRSR
jgi:hypothetical protein